MSVFNKKQWFPIPAAVLLAILSVPAGAADDKNGVPFESYPTKANAERFLKDNCKGIFGSNVKMGLNPEKRPRLLNACLLFSIAAGNKSAAKDYLEAGASPRASWPINYSNVRSAGIPDALWPDRKNGEAMDEDKSSTGIANALGGLLSSAMSRAAREYGMEEEMSGISADGLGFSAITLAVEANQPEILNLLLQKDASLAARQDSFFRCPVQYAYLRGRLQVAELLEKADARASQCVSDPRFDSQAVQVNKHMLNVGDKSIVGSANVGADWVYPQRLDLLTAQARAKQYEKVRAALNDGADVKVLVRDIQSRKDESTLLAVAEGANASVHKRLFQVSAELGFAEAVPALEKQGLKIGAEEILPLVGDSNPAVSNLGLKLAEEKGVDKTQIFQRALSGFERDLKSVQKDQKRIGSSSGSFRDFIPPGGFKYQEDMDRAIMAQMRREDYRNKETREMHGKMLNQTQALRTFDSLIEKGVISAADQVKIANAIGSADAAYLLETLYKSKFSAEALGSEKLRDLAARLIDPKGQQAYLDILLERGAHAEALQFIQIASKLDKVDAAEKILALNPKKEVLAESGLVHMAADLSGDAKGKALLKKLLALGLDLNQKDKAGNRPIDILVEKTKDGDEILAEAINAGMVPCDAEAKDGSDISLMNIAAYLGKAQHALTMYAAVEKHKEGDLYTTLANLVSKPEVPASVIKEATEKFLAAGLKLNGWSRANGKTLLMELSENRCDPELTEYFIRKGANASAEDKNYLTAGDAAVRFMNKQLGSGTMSCNSEEYQQLMGRCQRNASILVNHGAKFNAGWNVRTSCRN